MSERVKSRGRERMYENGEKGEQRRGDGKGREVKGRQAKRREGKTKQGDAKQGKGRLEERRRMKGQS